MSEIREERQVTQYKTVGKKCDVCGKESRDFHEYDKWFHGNHHHYEWGNDSVDSWEYFDICSPQCFVQQLKDSVEEMDGYSTVEIFDMSYEFAKGLVKEFGLGEGNG